MNQESNNRGGQRRGITLRTAGMLALACGVFMITPGARAAQPVAMQAAVTETAPAPAQAPATNRTNALVTDGLGADGNIRLMVNRSTIVATKSAFKRVNVAQPEIADVNPIGPNNVLITAKKAGTTQLIVWDSEERSQVMNINVEVDLEKLNKELMNLFPGDKI